MCQQRARARFARYTLQLQRVCVVMALSARSEYMLELSTDSRRRYEAKLTCCGLHCDPYALLDSKWSREPESLPAFAWSDVIIYTLSTPSPYTKESIKVRIVFTISSIHYTIQLNIKL